jgi:hypothetical protein
LKLVGVVVADAFLSDEFDELEEHLVSVLPGRGGFSDEPRETVRSFLMEARSRTSGGASTGHVQLANAKIYKQSIMAAAYGAFASNLVQSASLWLNNPAPGLAMLAVCFFPTEDGAALGEQFFRAHHPIPVTRRKGHRTFHTVELAKSRDLALELQRFIEANLFPAHAGRLQADRFPRGTIAIWSVPQVPEPSDMDWYASVGRVLNLSVLDHWDEEDGSLFRGLPPEGGFRQNGLTYLLSGGRSSQGEGEDGEGRRITSLLDSINDWHPWFLLGAATELLSVQAAHRRVALDRHRPRVLPRLRRLGQLARSIDDLRYRVSRVAWSHQTYEQYARIPKWRWHDPGSEMTHQEIIESDTLPPEQTFDQSVRWHIDHYLSVARSDIELSSDRVKSLLQLATPASIRLWTVAAVLVQLAALLAIILSR